MTGQTTARGAGGDGLKHIAIRGDIASGNGCIHVFFEPGMTWRQFVNEQYTLGSAVEGRLDFTVAFGYVRMELCGLNSAVFMNGQYIYDVDEPIDESGTYRY